MRVQDLDYTQNDWKAEVMTDDTILGFQEWLQHKQEADRLSPAEAQQHQTENLVAALTGNLQDTKDALSTAAHGITAAEAWAKGICINCKEPAAPKCHTPDG